MKSIRLHAICITFSGISQLSAFTPPQPSNPFRSHSHTSIIASLELTGNGNDHDISSTSKSYYSFDQMKSMESRLNNLQREAPELLCGFYESHLKSFSVRPGAVTVSRYHLSMCMSSRYYAMFRLEVFTGVSVSAQLLTEYIGDIHLFCSPSYLFCTRLLLVFTCGRSEL